MEATVVEKPKKRTRAANKIGRVKRIAMSYDHYDNWNPKDGNKYEWKNGFAIKNGTVMKNTERYIVVNINRKFTMSNYYQNEDALLPESRCKLDEFTTRIPDLAFFTKEQIFQSAKDEHPIPSFVIEIISKNDNTFETGAKIEEYFEAGVQTIWQVFPTLKQVWIFTDLKTARIFRNDEICSAAPALPDFSVSVNEIFKLD